MNKKILFLVIIIVAVILTGIYFWLQRASTHPVDTQATPTTDSATKIKNPTISNSANDLRGNNNLEAIGLTWTPDEQAAEYALFRSDSINGPFVEIGRVPAGPDRRTNAEDITADALTKTLCYKIEARDASGETIRIYEPICVPKWQE